MVVSFKTQGKAMLHVNFNLDVNASEKRVKMSTPQECTLTEANQMSISGMVEINGVDYRHHTFLHLVQDGWRAFSRVSLNNLDWRKDPTPAARKSAQLIPVLLSKALQNVEDMDEKRALAEERSIAHKLERCQQEYQKAQEAFEKAKNALELVKLQKESPIPAYAVLPEEEIERLSRL